MENIIQLKITLKGSKPPIWRRVLVKKDVAFDVLHHVIQICMGWQNYHLYEFETEKYLISEHDEEDYAYKDRKKLLESMTTKLVYVLTDKKFIYIYDFGDGWQHEILIEKFLPVDKKIKYPVCIAGKMHCPPEDCGGIGGYGNMLEALKDKNHPEYKEYKNWIGGYNFDTKYFDIEEVNNQLSFLNDYINGYNRNRDFEE